jgi:HEAT repeat protein
MRTQQNPKHGFFKRFRATQPKKTFRRSTPTMSTFWIGVAAALVPLITLTAAGWRKVIMSPYGPVDRPLTGRARKRHQILQAMPKNHDVLVNVSVEHLPSTPAMTLLGKKGLAALEKGLTHNVNAGVRYRIAVVLTELADHHSLGALQAALKDWNVSVRRQAAEGLGALGSAKAAPALIKMLDDPEERVYTKADAIRALGAIGARRVARRLLSILKDEKQGYHMRQAALHALWDMRFKISQNILREAVTWGLGAKFTALRTFAAAAAAELKDGSPSIRRALLKNARHPNSEVRNVSVYALGEIGNPTPIAALRKRLPAARSGRLLNNIAFALYKMGDLQVVSKLGDLLKHRQAVIRLNAAFVLGDTGEKGAVPLLLRALKDGNDAVRASAVAALGKIGDPRAVAPLERLTKVKNLSLRILALKALNHIKGGKLNGRIKKELLEHPYASVRRKAAFELARYGDARAIPTLLRCLSRKRCSVYRVAAALKKIKSWRATSAALTAYTVRWGNYGQQRLLETVQHKRLTAGQQAILRSHLPLVWHQHAARRALIRTLGKLQDRTARTAYWSVLKSRDTMDVLNGAYALANQGYKGGRHVLVNALTQGAPQAKRLAARLIRAVHHPKSKKDLHRAVKKALSGHGGMTKAAAAYALMAWNPARAIRILIDLMKTESRLLRQEAGRYLTRDEMSKYTAVIKKALKRAKNPPLKGALRRIVMQINPAHFTPKLWQRLPF